MTSHGRTPGTIRFSSGSSRRQRDTPPFLLYIHSDSIFIILWTTVRACLAQTMSHMVRCPTLLRLYCSTDHFWPRSERGGRSRAGSETKPDDEKENDNEENDNEQQGEEEEERKGEEEEAQVCALDRNLVTFYEGGWHQTSQALLRRVQTMMFPCSPPTLENTSPKVYLVLR